MNKLLPILIALAAMAIVVAVAIFDAPDYLFFLFFLLIAIVVIAAGSKQGQFDYLQQILATSKIGSVASGLAEIVGFAKPYGELNMSPIGDLPCIAFLYTVEEKRVTRDSDGQEEVKYVEVKRQQTGDKFYLHDDTGQIEIDAKHLSWFGFQPANEYLSGSYRYREYILDETIEILMIGQAWYSNNRPVFKYSEDKKILAMAPLNWVDFHNKWRPLKRRAVFMLAIFALFAAFVLVVPVQLNGSQLIINLLVSAIP